MKPSPLQYEDNIGPYFDITRELYKDLVRYDPSQLEKADLHALLSLSSVAKDGSGTLFVNSIVVRINALVSTLELASDSCFSFSPPRV